MGKKLRSKLRTILDLTPFSPKHIGDYVRQGCFWRYVRTISPEIGAILDAGCGHGHYAMKMAHKFPHARITALDIKPVMSMNNFQLNVSVVTGDLLLLDATDTYDLIYSIDVLEHIPGNQKVVHNFYRALKMGGYLYLHTPNRIQGRRFFPIKLFKKFDAWVKDEHIGDSYTLDELKQTVSGCGFEIINAQYTFGKIGQFA